MNAPTELLLDHTDVHPPLPNPGGGLAAQSSNRLLVTNLTEEEMMTLSVPELASRCGLSVRHFSRLFFRAFHISLRSRRTELRLAKARRMLDETSFKVSEVARASGYRHLGLFNASFKKRFGLTPLEARRLARRPPPDPRSLRE